MIEIILAGDKDVRKLQRCKYCGTKFTLTLGDVYAGAVVGVKGQFQCKCPVCYLSHDVDFSHNYTGGNEDD